LPASRSPGDAQRVLEGAERRGEILVGVRERQVHLRVVQDEDAALDQPRFVARVS
jgi:hypothetical protein